MSDERDERIEELTRQNESLRAQLAETVHGPSAGVPGKRIVTFFFATIALAFATALTLFAMAKRTVSARQETERAVVPTVSRVDAAGRAMVHAIAECAAETPGEQTIEVRVKLAPTGQLALLDTKVTPNDETLIQCIRRAPTLVHVAQGDTGSIDVDVRYATSTDPDGTHVLKTAWAVRPAGEK